MTFDIDQHHATVCPPWHFRQGGQVFTARHVSTPTVERFIAATNRATTDAARQRALYHLLRAAFPWRVSYLWRKWEDPVRRLLWLDGPTQLAAIEDFFAALGIDRQVPQGLGPLPVDGSAASGSGPSAT